MAWFKGTATDYHDFLEQLKNLVKNDHISVADVYDGGTGYLVEDTITLAGGTKDHEPEMEVRAVSSGDYVTVAAVNAGGANYNIGDSLVLGSGTYSVAPVLEVLTVSGTAVATILIKNPGIASAQPSNPVATTTDGGGSGCTIDLTFAAGTGIITDVHIADAGVYTSQASNPVLQNTSSGSGTGAKFEVTYLDTAWELKVDHKPYEATAVAIGTAGTGYSTDDKVTIVGGSFTEATVVNIDAQSGGVPSAVSVYSSGEYISTPSNDADVSGGTGTGLKLTMTWTYHVEEFKYLMIHNTTSDQYIGWKAFKVTSPGDAYLFQVAGFTGFNSSSTPWKEQPGCTVALTANDDCYVPLSGGGTPATIYYWISVQDQRVTASFKVASVYPNMYLGGFDKYLVQTAYEYPQIILGCICRKNSYTYGGVDFAGMNNPGAQIADSDTYSGPGWLRRPDGTLAQIINWQIIGGNPNAWDDAINISPVSGVNYTTLTSPNNWYISQDTWREMFSLTLTPAASQNELLRVNGEFVILPCTLASKTDARIYGNMTGIFCFNPDAAVNAEDRIFIGTAVYRAFQNCNKSSRNYFFLIREN